MADPSFPAFAAADLPAVTMEQMREVDRIMIEDLHIELVQMMENAGRNLARLALSRFRPERVVVMAGSGGNGGGGMVAARHLANWGLEVSVVLSREPEALGAVAAHQLDVLDRMGVPVDTDPRPDALYVDALIGYSLRSDPRGRAAELITWLRDRPGQVLSLDTPTGLDVTTGAALTPCVSADATLTLAAPKIGLLHAPEVGELYLSDISVPPAVYEAFEMTMPADLFADGSVVRLTTSSSAP